MIMAQQKFSMRNLARMYGYDESTVRSWRDRGMPTDSDADAQAWIVQNIITPLRDVDLQERLQQERLRKLVAEADKEELELQEMTGQLISTAYLQQSLTSYFSQIKNQMRTIPVKTYLELFESKDALELKQILSAAIDSVLQEIGNSEFELPEEEQNEQQGKVEINTTDSTESNSASKETPTE